MFNKYINIFILFVLSSCIIQNIGASVSQNENGSDLISIKNEIYGNSYEPELTYTIKTPKIVDYDFVLALDSSGSIEDGDGLQRNAIVEEVPKFVRDIPKLYPDANFNISIISWDDNIDFAYDSKKGFDNSKTIGAKLADLNASMIDIDNNFAKKFTTLETETTNISVATKASFDILNSDINRANNYHKNKKFAILVVGNGEFKPATNEVIEDLQEKNYKVYVIGMDPKPEPSKIRENIRQIAENSRDQYIFLPIGKLYPALNKSLDSALRSHLENATKSPVADNVKIKETFYCYYIPDKRSIKINGGQIDPSYIKIIPNNDGTNTAEIEIPGGLLPNSITQVTMSAKFDPGNLPVTVTKDRRQVILCSPNFDTPIGKVSFDWFTRDHFELGLKKAEQGIQRNPSNHLIIQSAELKRDLEGENIRTNTSILNDISRTLSISRILNFLF